MAMNPALLEAATAGDHDGVLRLVEEDRGRLTGVTARGNTLLHISARLGNEQIATLVGGLLPGLLAQVNSAGDTALHLAARAGHVLVVSSLVQEESWNLYPGALFMAKNRKGDTALHEAVRNRHALVASGLIRSCPALASVVNDSNESPLYLAAERASTVIVEELLACETANWEGPGGKTALHAAVFRSYDIAEVLLTKKPEFIRKQDSSQSTPLHYAASVGDPQMVQLLLAYDASAAYTPDAEGLSPVHVAAAMGHVAVIQELIQTCPECGELTDNRGRNLLHFAVEKKRPEVVKYVLRTPLLGEIINEGDNDGNTALHLATVNCSREAVLILLADKRVNTNVTNRKGFTPLDMASSCTKSYIGLRMVLPIPLRSNSAVFSLEQHLE